MIFVSLLVLFADAFNSKIELLERLRKWSNQVGLTKLLRKKLDPVQD